MNTVSLLLSMTYFFLPSTAMSIFAIYPCDRLDNGNRYLKTDYSVSCDDSNEVRGSEDLRSEATRGRRRGTNGVRSEATKRGEYPSDSLRSSLTPFLALPSSQEHKWYLAYAAVMLCVYPIGIPTLYAFLLTKDVSKLNPPRKSKNLNILGTNGESYDSWEEKISSEREHDDTIQHTIFLWGSYRPAAWWYEIFECAR